MKAHRLTGSRWRSLGICPGRVCLGCMVVLLSLSCEKMRSPEGMQGPNRETAAGRGASEGAGTGGRTSGDLPFSRIADTASGADLDTLYEILRGALRLEAFLDYIRNDYPDVLRRSAEGHAEFGLVRANLLADLRILREMKETCPSFEGYRVGVVRIDDMIKLHKALDDAATYLKYGDVVRAKEVVEDQLAGFWGSPEDYYPIILSGDSGPGSRSHSKLGFWGKSFFVDAEVKIGRNGAGQDLGTVRATTPITSTEPFVPTEQTILNCFYAYVGETFIVAKGKNHKAANAYRAELLRHLRGEDTGEVWEFLRWPDLEFQKVVFRSQEGGVRSYGLVCVADQFVFLTLGRRDLWDGRLLRDVEALFRGE